MIKNLIKDVLSAIAITAAIVLTVAAAPQIVTQAHNQLMKAYLQQATMILTGTSEAGRWSGTGFLTRTKSGKSVIMTNLHVCGTDRNKHLYPDEPNARIFLQDKTELKRLAVNPKFDLCIMEAPEQLKDRYHLRVRGGPADVGAQLFSYGFPYAESAYTTGKLNGNRFEMIVRGEALLMQKNYPQWLSECSPAIDGGYVYCVMAVKTLSISNSVYPGASGSPVVDFLGQITAVVWGYNPTTGEGLAVPQEAIKSFLETL